MTSPACVDPASEIVTAIITSLQAVFSPQSDCPPAGGGTTTVRFFAGEGAPIEEVNCEAPLVWVRLATRFRSEEFPEPSVTVSLCGAPEVVSFELGVARCSSMGGEGTYADFAVEAETSLDDSWRLSKAVCALSTLMPERQIGSDLISPYGPEGGIIAWTTVVYVSV